MRDNNIFNERIVPGTVGWDMLSEEHKIRYQFAVHYCEGKRILDAACGSGYGSYLLIQNGAKQVCGVDISTEAINYAKQNYFDPDMEFLIGDCERLDTVNRKFDVVVSFETIEHLNNPENFLFSVSRILNDQGIFICSTPNKNNPHPENPYHCREMYLDEIEAILKKHFLIKEKYYQSRTEAYGRYLKLLGPMVAMTSSRIFNLVEKIRRLIGRKPMLPEKGAFSPRPVDGDYKIYPLDEENSMQEVFIFICEAL